jgi:hypothetical protein
MALPTILKRVCGSSSILARSGKLTTRIKHGQ